MADITWLTGLPAPLISSFSRYELVGFSESPLAAGPSVVELFSEDMPQFHSVSYIMKAGDARRFQMWLRKNKFRSMSPWFDGPLVTEDRSVATQECRYTADGYPQLTGVTKTGLKMYSATIMTREIVNNDDDYEDTIDAMWTVNDGEIDQFASLFDEGLNG